MHNIEGRLPTTVVTSHEIFQLRLVIGIASATNFCWGLFPNQFSPVWGLAPFHHFVTAFCFLCLGLTFIMTLSVQRIEALKFFVGFAICSHSIYAAIMHQNSMDEVISAAIALMIASSIFEVKSWGKVFASLMTLEVGAFIYLNSQLQTTPVVALMWIVLIVIGIGTSFSRINKQEKSNFSTNFINSLINQMTEGVIVHDSEGKIVKMNHSAEKILATHSENSIGKTNRDPMWQTFYEDDRPMKPENHPSTISLKENRTVIGFPIKFVSSETGEVKFIEVNSVPMWTTSTVHPEFALVTITDKTNVKKTEAELHRQKEILVQTNKLSALGEMAAGIAHEINNPLAISLSRLMLIKKKVSQLNIDHSPIDAEIDLVEKSLGRIGKIVKNMRSLVRNSTQDPLQKESMNQLIQNILDIAMIGIQKFNITVQFEECVQTDLVCNSIEIEQVLINFLQNSVDAIKELEEKWIHLRLFDDQDYVYVSVTDSGRGIAPEIIEKMSQPFFTTKQIGHGTGLGHSISRAIVQRHQGSIKYVSTSTNTQFLIALKKNLTTTDVHKTA